MMTFFLAHGVAWTAVCELCLYANDEIRDYIRTTFRDEYDVDSYDIAFVAALYIVSHFYNTNLIVNFYI